MNMSCVRGFGLDLEILKRISRDRLIQVLEDVPGPKELIIDGELMKLLDRITDAKTLKSHGVSKMFRFETILPSHSVSKVVYLLRPTLTNIKTMADHVHTMRLQDQVQLQFHLVCVPRVMSWVSLLLEEEGLFGVVILHEFCPEFIPLDEDLLSLDMQSFFRNAFIDCDFSGCVAIARALQTLQNLYGPFSNVFAHGRAASAVFKSLEKLEEDQKTDRATLGSDSSSRALIDHVFVMDRDADLVTPLLSQLTYEGALDEHFGIRAGVVEFPPVVAGTEQPLKVPLNSRDVIFDSIRNRHFGGLSAHLARRARELRGRKDATATMSAAQIKSFVSDDLRTLQTQQKSLSLHISACEAINAATRNDFEAQLVTEHGLITGAGSATATRAHLEDLMARQAPSRLALRLLCLYSVSRKGLPRREYEHLATLLCNAYGPSHLLTLLRLRRAGLLLLADGEETGGASVLRQVASSLGVRRAGQWQALIRRLDLVPQGEEPIDLHNPSHMSYVFNGAYTPVIPCLIKEALAKGVNAVADAVKLIPGLSAVRSAAPADETGLPTKGSTPRVVLVVVLGGITFAEIASLRLLGASTTTRVLIASTCTITGSTLVGSAISN